MNDQSNLLGSQPQPFVVEPENHVNQPGTEPLPEALRRGGRLDQLLQAAVKCRHNSEYGGLAILLPAITANLEYERGGPQTDIDPVFWFVLAGLQNNENQLTNWHDKAMTAYRRQRKNYDLVFAELIPQSFRDELNHIESYDAYVRGVNPTAHDDFKVYFERLRARRSGWTVRVSTGLSSLDKILSGLRGISFLGGRPGVGKTTLALDIAYRSLLADPNSAALIYSMDMSKDVIYDRLLCREADVDYATLMLGGSAPAAASAELKAAGQRLREVMRRIRVIDEPLKSKQFVPLARELLTAAQASQFLVIVDYLQLVPVPKRFVGEEADRCRIRKLQRLQASTRNSSCPLGSPFLVISELRKADFSSDELEIEDLLGSARLAYGADTILLLQGSTKAASNPDAVEVSLKLAKGRDGTSRTTIPLIFEHRVCRFRELTLQDSVKHSSSRTAAAPRRKINPMAGTVPGEKK